jgi:hypothetical protein
MLYFKLPDELATRRKAILSASNHNGYNTDQFANSWKVGENPSA